MKNVILGIAVALLPAMALAADNGFVPPPWAYPAMDPNFKPEKDDGSDKRVPGSSQTFKIGQIETIFDVPDWYPNEHPPLPEVVARGRKPDVRACGACHLPNGMGHPESASLTGMSAGYLMQQMTDFKEGKRGATNTGRPWVMASIAAAITADELRDAVTYFSSLKPAPWVAVKEAATVPATFVALGNMRFVTPNGGIEPIGTRIIEVPADPARVKLKDSHTGFVAYVPPGSIKAGEALVTTGGNGKTVMCAVCHGPDLKGLGDVPNLAGRSPIYVVRQLLDIQRGARNGPGAQLMKTVVAKLTPEDMVNIAAYTASRNP